MVLLFLINPFISKKGYLLKRVFSFQSKFYDTFVNTEFRDLELPTGLFSLRQIKAATCNFDPANKIGEGSFGPVYKVVINL